jgi:hypothetical protein
MSVPVGAHHMAMGRGAFALLLTSRLVHPRNVPLDMPLEQC